MIILGDCNSNNKQQLLTELATEKDGCGTINTWKKYTSGDWTNSDVAGTLKGYSPRKDRAS